MKRHLAILAFCLASIAASRAESPPADAATLITDAAHDPAWQDIFARLAPDKNRLSAFEERRYFSFRKTPVVLTGEIRIVPSRGLSLHYLTPESHIVIVDDQGLLLRDDQGRQRAVPADSRAQAATGTLVDVLRFNLPQLQKNFELRGRHDASGWTLTLAPRDPALAGGLTSLVVSGEGGRLRKIELINSPMQRIEILIGETHEDVVFPADVLARYFR
jgi:outer membrane lipoprotein-sorting protein